MTMISMNNENVLNRDRYLLFVVRELQCRCVVQLHHFEYLRLDFLDFLHQISFKFIVNGYRLRKKESKMVAVTSADAARLSQSSDLLSHFYMAGVNGIIPHYLSLVLVSRLRSLLHSFISAFFLIISSNKSTGFFEFETFSTRTKLKHNSNKSIASSAHSLL